MKWGNIEIKVMTALDQLKDVADNKFESIKHAVMNDVYLNLQETYKLLDEIDDLNEMKHNPYKLIFYGADFKIIMIEVMSDEFGVDNTELEFELISFDLPKDKTIYKPTSLTKMWFSTERSSFYPFETK